MMAEITAAFAVPLDAGQEALAHDTDELTAAASWWLPTAQRAPRHKGHQAGGIQAQRHASVMLKT